jgi:hypothetical protein
MEVEFALDEEDLIALAKYLVKHSPAARSRYQISRIGIPLGLGLAGALTYALFSLKAPALYLAAFALFFWVFFPYYYRWLVGRTMRKTLKARSNPTALVRRTLRVTPEGLELVTAGAKTRKSWDQVSGIEVTPARAFVAIEGGYAIVLPRMGLGDETFQRLLDDIRRLAKPASQAETPAGSSSVTCQPRS